jgi:hypothetical protein
MFAFPTMLLKNLRKELTAKFKNGAFHVFLLLAGISAAATVLTVCRHCAKHPEETAAPS